jgi:hypothetical protein
MHISNDFPSFVSLGQRDRTLGPISTLESDTESSCRAAAISWFKVVNVCAPPVPIFTGAAFMEISALPVEVSGGASTEGRGRVWKCRGVGGLRDRGMEGPRNWGAGVLSVLSIVSIVNKITHFVEIKRWPLERGKWKKNHNHNNDDDDKKVLNVLMFWRVFLILEMTFNFFCFLLFSSVFLLDLTFKFFCFLSWNDF